MITLIIAEDHDMVREGLRSLLEKQNDLQVIGEAQNGIEAVEKSLQLRPDVLLLDLTLPRLHGLHVLSQVRAIKKTRVIVLTMHQDDASVLETLRLGAKGYVVKNSSSVELLAAIRAVAAKKEIFVSPQFRDLVHRTAFRIRGDKDDPIRLQLTRREHIVLSLCANGKKNSQIAQDLGISVRTAEKHRANMMRKLGLRSQSEIMLYGLRHNLIQA